MGKKVILFCLVMVFCLPVNANIKGNEDFNIYNYKQSDTITFEEYLYTHKTRKDRKTLKINNNGDVIFKNKVVLTDKGIPLNDNTAYTDTELKILFTAKGIKPKKWCNPKNTRKNGILGCYVDNPD